jgi:hypothetical protein
MKENVVLKNELRYFLLGIYPDFLACNYLIFLAIISFFLLKQEKQLFFLPHK